MAGKWLSTVASSDTPGAIAGRAHGGLLTVNEVAVRTNLSSWWVRRLINSGELRAINIGGIGTGTRWRIDEEDLRGWLASRENRHRDLVASL